MLLSCSSLRVSVVNRRIPAALTAFFAAAAFTVTGVLGQTLSGRQYQSQAHISLAHARAAALHIVPNGKIVDQELEKERGGSGLRYSFDIKSGSATYEVGIDAKTGKVLEKSTEGANPD